MKILIFVLLIPLCTNAIANENWTLIHEDKATKTTFYVKLDNFKLFENKVRMWVMESFVGYTLEDRISGKKLFNTHGQEIGELDGLLCYQHEQTKKKVAIMVEAKTNMSHAEFRKVHKTVRHWKDLIQKTNEPSNQSWPLKYVNQYNLFKALINYDHLVAVGSPIMPEDIGKEAVKMGYLIVSHDSYEIENGPQWSTEHVL